MVNPKKQLAMSVAKLESQLLLLSESPKYKFCIAWTSCLAISLFGAAAIQWGVSPQHVTLAAISIITLCIFFGSYMLPKPAQQANKARQTEVSIKENIPIDSFDSSTALTVNPVHRIVESPQFSAQPFPLYLTGYRARTVSPGVTLYFRPTEVLPVFHEQLHLAHAQPQVVVFTEANTFEDLITGVEPRLRRLLAVYRIPSEDAEDLLQQALLALLYQWDRVRDPANWLVGTLRRNCLIYWRTHRRRIYSAVDSAILDWLSEPIAPSQERSELLLDLDSLIQRLPPRCRSVLRLRFRLGYDPPEVARLLGYRQSSIGKITTRCLAALSREVLASGLLERFPKSN
jgi:RNA polymerase sigma factor (sigma-70 family)